MTTYSRSREGLLSQANLGSEKLRFLFDIASELQCLDLCRYEHAAGAKRFRHADTPRLAG